jgi:hypothetical protein
MLSAPVVISFVVFITARPLLMVPLLMVPLLVPPAPADGKEGNCKKRNLGLCHRILLSLS